MLGQVVSSRRSLPFLPAKHSKMMSPYAIVAVADIGTAGHAEGRRRLMNCKAFGR
jgi:hypothetical protein